MYYCIIICTSCLLRIKGKKIGHNKLLTLHYGRTIHISVQYYCQSLHWLTFNSTELTRHVSSYHYMTFQGLGRWLLKKNNNHGRDTYNLIRIYVSRCSFWCIAFFFIWNFISLIYIHDDSLTSNIRHILLKIVYWHLTFCEMFFL